MGGLGKIVFLPAFIDDSLGDIPINRPLEQVKANGIAIFHQPYGASDGCLRSTMNANGTV